MALSFLLTSCVVRREQYYEQLGSYWADEIKIMIENRPHAYLGAYDLYVVFEDYSRTVTAVKILDLCVRVQDGSSSTVVKPSLASKPAAIMYGWSQKRWDGFDYLRFRKYAGFAVYPWHWSPPSEWEHRPVVLTVRYVVQRGDSSSETRTVDIKLRPVTHSELMPDPAIFHD